MSNQTETYIILKPIAERFSRIANAITDEEIRGIIKSEMREQLKKVDFSYEVMAIIETYLDDPESGVLDLYKSGLRDRLK